MTHTPIETQKAESAGFIMAVKIIDGKNMADLGQNRHFLPAIIIPSKVTRENYGVFYHDWGNYGRGKIWRK